MNSARLFDSDSAGRSHLADYGPAPDSLEHFSWNQQAGSTDRQFPGCETHAPERGDQKFTYYRSRLWVYNRMELEDYLECRVYMLTSTPG